MKRMIFILGPIIGLGLFGCSSETPKPTIEKSYDVEFRVIGTAAKAAIGYHCDHKRDDHSVVMELFDVPFERKFNCKPGPGINFTLSATHNVNYPGSLECEIWVDGEKKDSEFLDQIQDGLSMVSCSVFP